MRLVFLFFLALLLGGMIGCSTGDAPQKREVRIGETRPGVRTRGEASWYGGKFHGRQTANGEKYNKNALTAAHRTLPFGTRVRVTNLENGRSVVVRINDRYPGTKRVIDLSEGSFKRLAPLEQVSLELLRKD